MEIEGKIWKAGELWLVEISALDAMTQGKTRREALVMAKNLVFEMANSYFEKQAENFSVVIVGSKKNVIGISSSDSRLLLALALKRRKEKSC